MMDQEDCESRPEVGSSRKTRRAGLAASSTPMVRRFLCSTLRPMPTSPTSASAYGSISRSLMISSTYSSFSALGTLRGSVKRA